MGRTSKSNKIRGVATGSEREVSPELRSKDYYDINSSRLPRIDENGNFVWDINQNLKESYYPAVFDHEKNRVQKMALGIIDRHEDRNLLTPDDANNFIRSRLYKAGYYINAIEHGSPNPPVEALLSNFNTSVNFNMPEKTHPVPSLMTVRPGEIYKFLYGMARGRERLNNKLQDLQKGKRVAVSDLNGQDSGWYYIDKHVFGKPVVLSGNKKAFALIVPRDFALSHTSKININSVRANFGDKRSERMMLIFTNPAKTKIISKEKIPLFAFNSETTGAHASLVTDASARIAAMQE